MEKENKKPKTISRIVLLDNEGLEIASHGITGVILLAHPDEEEKKKFEDKKKGYSLISYQAGDPKIVMALLITLEKIIPSIAQKWAKALEELKPAIFTAKDGEKL